MPVCSDRWRRQLIEQVFRSSRASRLPTGSLGLDRNLVSSKILCSLFERWFGLGLRLLHIAMTHPALYAVA